jgi:hypothetical protein
MKVDMWVGEVRCDGSNEIGIGCNEASYCMM